MIPISELIAVEINHNTIFTDAVDDLKSIEYSQIKIGKNQRWEDCKMCGCKEKKARNKIAFNKAGSKKKY